MSPKEQSTAVAVAGSEVIVQPPQDTLKIRLKRTVHYFYDLQKMRVGVGNRTSDPTDFVEVEKVNKKGEKQKVRKKKPTTRAHMEQAMQNLIKSQQARAEALQAEMPEEPAGLPSAAPVLDEDDRQYLKGQELLLRTMELETLARIEDMLAKFPIYDAFLNSKKNKDQKGCGPTLSGVIISEVEMWRPADPTSWVSQKPLTITDENGKDWPYVEAVIETEVRERQDDGSVKKQKVQHTIYCYEYTNQEGVKEWRQDVCPTPSSLWSYSGLAVDPETGLAVRRKKGVKSNWNPFLKTKMVAVLAGCFMKANSPWRSYYDNYKHRKQNEQVAVCAGCGGSGRQKPSKNKFGDTELEEAKKDEKGTVPCSNCKGTGGPAPWGRSDGHRDLASKRFMVKHFLLALWRKWREVEHMPLVPPYSEAVLGRAHGDHGGTNVLPFRKR